MLRSKRTWGGVAFVVLVVVVGYVAWLGLSVRSELQAAQARADGVQSALSAGDSARAARELAGFTADVGSARARTDSLGWRLLTHLPFVGDDARAVATVADVGVGLAKDGVAPVVRVAQGGLAGQLAPHHGRIDLAAVQGLGPVLDGVRTAFDGAAHRLDAVDAGGLTGWVRNPLNRLSDKVDSATEAVDSAGRAVDVLPSMFGASGPRRLLLLFENNAEIRATGGIPGAYAVVNARDGRISLGRQGSAADFGELPHPVLPQTKAEHAIYGDQPTRYLQDVNFVPEFPRTADLARAMYAQKYGVKVDAVMSVDTVSLAYLLKATGPITVPGGVTLTSNNAVDELLNGTYTRLRDPKAQDAYFAEVAKQVFAKVSDGGGSPSALLSALSRAVTEGRAYVHSFDAGSQQRLDGTKIAGQVDFSATANPQVGVYLDDATGAKMSYFLRTDVRLHSDRCDSGQQALSGYADFHMIQPRPDQLTKYVTGGGVYGIPTGQQLVIAHIYGPAGGELSDFRFDGKPVQADIAVDRGRPTATVVVQLKGGQTVRVRWTTRTATNSPRATDLSVTPGVDSGSAVTQIQSSCR